MKEIKYEIQGIVDEIFRTWGNVTFNINNTYSIINSYGVINISNNLKQKTFNEFNELQVLNIKTELFEELHRIKKIEDNFFKNIINKIKKFIY